MSDEVVGQMYPTGARKEWKEKKGKPLWVWYTFWKIWVKGSQRSGLCYSNTRSVDVEY